MYMNLGHQARLSDHGLISVCSWSVNGERTYAFDGGVYIAGAAIQWLRDKLRVIENSAQTEAIAQSVEDTGGVYFVPAFSGLAAPHWDQYARGMINWHHRRDDEGTDYSGNPGKHRFPSL